MRRFELINSADDFTDSEAGMEKLDAICMQLIAIGESLKNLVKVTDHKLLPSYPEVDWKKASQTNIKNPPLLCELCESINF